MDNSLKDRVRKYILDNHLIDKGDGVVVGISGGADSLCLAHILLELRQSMGFEICLAHLNHSLRGEESEDDMDFISQLSREWDITAIFETADVYDYVFKKGLNLEEAARVLRYNFFVRAAFQFNASRVAVGHTADDQVETVLMHLLRGSGMKGMRGMSPSLGWVGEYGTVKVIRPLLDVWRRETEKYCRLNALEPRVDSTNIDRAFLRNRLRLELVPDLQKINAKAKESILRLARITADEADYLDGEVERLSKETIAESGKALFLKTDRILSLHPALQRLLFFRALGKIYGSARDLETHHVERLRSASGSNAGYRVTLPDGLLFLKDYEGGWLCHNEEEVCPFPPISGEQEVPIEGESIYGPWRIKIKKVQTQDKKYSVFQKSEVSMTGAFHAVISLDRASEKLKVRGKKDGDRFQPLGMEGTKKLQDFMTDEKIPRWWREHIPFLCAGEDILWVAGWRISELAKVREGDEKIIEVALQPLSAEYFENMAGILNTKGALTRDLLEERKKEKEMEEGR